MGSIQSNFLLTLGLGNWVPFFLSLLKVLLLLGNITVWRDRSHFCIISWLSLTISKSTQVDYLGRVWNWLKFLLLIVWILSNFLFFFKVSIFREQLTMSILNLIKYATNNVLNFFDCFRISHHIHEPEPVDLRILLSRYLQLRCIIRSLDIQVIDENIDRFDILSDSFNLTVLLVFIQVAVSDDEIELRNEPVRLEPLPLWLLFDDFFVHFDRPSVFLLDHKYVPHPSYRSPQPSQDLVYIRLTAPILYFSHLLFIYLPSQVQIPIRNGLIVILIFLILCLFLFFRHFLVYFLPFNYFRLILVNFDLFSLTFPGVDCFRVFFWVAIVLCHIFLNFFLLVVGIVRQFALVEDIHVCLYLLKYEVPILIVELRHMIIPFPQFFLGSHHELVKLLIYLVLPSLLGHRQQRPQVLHTLPTHFKINIAPPINQLISL